MLKLKKKYKKTTIKTKFDERFIHIQQKSLCEKYK